MFMKNIVDSCPLQQCVRKITMGCIRFGILQLFPRCYVSFSNHFINVSQNFKEELKFKVFQTIQQSGLHLLFTTKITCNWWLEVGMKEKLNKNKTMSSVTQLRPYTKRKHPDDCYPASRVSFDLHRSVGKRKETLWAPSTFFDLQPRSQGPFSTFSK